MGNIFAIAQLDMQYTPASLLPSAVRDVLARRHRAAFAAGASGKKKLNKREQKDARGPRPSII